MDVLSGVRDNWFNVAASTLLVFAATCSGSAEDNKLTGGPTPSPPGAAAHFLELKDGDAVPTKVTVRFGLREMGVAPAGLDRPNSGHHHLLIDSDLPPLNEPIPNDFNHLHFGAGQTEAQVTLKPGPHTLQLLLGDKDHIPHSPPVMSPRIRVIASDATTSPQVAAASVKKRRNAQARGRNYHSSAAYRKNSRSRSY
jgi:Domain of unknown function (DUF4399)